MKREEFLLALEEALADAPADEREAALQYYNDYLDDAGSENEESVIDALGNPKDLAKEIYADATETEIPEDTDAPASSEKTKKTKEKAPINVWKWIVLGVLGIIVCPVVLTVALALIATVITLALAVLVILACLALAGVAVMGGGLATAGIGVLRIFVIPAGGLFLTGIGILMMAIGLLAAVFFVWTLSKTIVWMAKGLVNVCSKPFHKKKGGAENA